MRGNSIAVEGRIYPRGKDESQIDLRYSAGGTAFSSFTISAWSHKNKDTDENEYVSYRCVAFGDLAEHIAESLEPGDTVVGFGRLQSNNWEDDEGKKRYDTQLLIDQLGASLRWTSVAVDRTESTSGTKKSGSRPQARDDYGPDEAPF